MVWLERAKIGQKPLRFFFLQKYSYGTAIFHDSLRNIDRNCQIFALTVNVIGQPLGAAKRVKERKSAGKGPKVLG